MRETTNIEDKLGSLCLFSWSKAFLLLTGYGPTGPVLNLFAVCGK